ncbi:helicase with zinc finger domain 2-like isoform X2 [Mercenaria mercenaria]|uniref:helicase with zinc finger domain 2-like isoform X2 n=1 Tax=Mercenaria mercenaria TaxID=6596 RepID=UPI00234F7AD6|nr:helicase with zinc finger domain 2-like isoform X2 [Mercenaria mercenaria]
MAARKISSLILESQDALKAFNKPEAKQKALQAIVDINIEKERLLTGKKTDINEQQLGDWYGGCSFVMNKIGENLNATKCFYTAIVFDPSWDVVKHENVSRVLWTSLVFSKKIAKLSKDIKGLKDLLSEIDDLAKLAERRGKWNVCVAVDDDINTIFSYFIQQGLEENELIKQLGRKESLWRSARCKIKMGMQEDARNMCSTILQHACDYDDPEAFEIWAVSLYNTKDFDLAFEKCELALHYCKDNSYRQRLGEFRSQIQTQILANTHQEQHEEFQDTNYQDVQRYLERWLPIISMEAAAGIVRNAESLCINNVPVKFLEGRKGKFSLGHHECELRNIEFSGMISDDTDYVSCDETTASHDWLCLKATLPKLEKSSPKDETALWTGHASVINVVKRKSQRYPDEKIHVTFQLHNKEPNLPSNLPTDTTFSVEILKKSEVDRRTESVMKELLSQRDSLAAKIAMNKPIPDCGTGKTNVCIKLMYLFDRINYQLSKEGHPRKQVLFCGQSNKDMDLIAEWMLERMDQYKPSFVRVYERSIEAIDFPIPGQTFLYKRSSRSLPTNQKLKCVALHHLIREEGKKYAEKINATDKFFEAHNCEPMPDLVKDYVHTVSEASVDEIKKYNIILCTTESWANPTVLEATNIYQVIVDEAGMCSEPQCLIPIIVTKAEQVVLIGDHKQLRPTILCKEAALLGLEKSLFERYATTELSTNVQFTMLEHQNRMNPEICRFPSKQFYKSALRTMCGIWRDETLRIWPQDAKGVYPHVLVHVEGEEQIRTVSTGNGNEQSMSNDAEIGHVVMTYNYLTSQEPNASIQILSQYNAQCSDIKKRLENEGIEGVDEIVSTVVSSHGREWDYVIFSTVRSLTEDKIEKNPTLGWCKHNLGFITDRNQMNVALTRARKGLVIIGNKYVLACDYVWKRLIQHYKQRGCMKTPEEFPPKNIRKSRRQIMEEARERSRHRYGK